MSGNVRGLRGGVPCPGAGTPCLSGDVRGLGGGVPCRCTPGAAFRYRTSSWNGAAGRSSAPYKLTNGASAHA